jgi:tripartite-type tricarboxylate transporter receptor subunit TctC
MNAISFGRRRLLSALAALPALAFAQSAPPFPSKPVRFLLGAPPGGVTDPAARLIANHLSKLAGQPVLVENRPGANGIIAATAVAKAPPDGHTLFLGVQFPVVNVQALYRSLPYDPNHDFALVTPFASGYVTLGVSRTVPATNLNEFVEYARRTPGLGIGSWGPGSQGHLGVEAINKRYGLSVPHVAYKGEGPMTQDILGGHLAAGFGSLASMGGPVKAGHIRVIAVVGDAGASRMALLPDVPTFGQQGLDDPAVTLRGWLGILTTAGTPRPIVAKLNEWIRSALAQAEFLELMKSFGMEVISSTPEQFESRFRAETPAWVKMINELGVKLD